MNLWRWFHRHPDKHVAHIVYESRKGALLGPGSGIKTAEQARQVGAVLRGQKPPKGKR